MTFGLKHLKAEKPTALKETSSCGWEIWQEAGVFWRWAVVQGFILIFF
jgi:hypothetical protein